MPVAANVLVDVLRESGVRRVYGVPGEHCLDIVDAIGQDPDVDFIAARHESGAAYMAEAEAKLTGRLGVCIGTAAVGAANLAVGIHTARQDSTPVLALVGQASTAVRLRESWQETDIAAFFKPLAKDAFELPRADRIAELSVRAVRSALSGRPGPVVMSIPEDMQSASAPSRVRRVDVDASPPTLTPDDADDIVARLAGASNPVIVLGGASRAYRGAAEVSELARRLGARVVAGFRRHDSFPDGDPAFLGTVSLSTSEAVRRALIDADVILALGSRLSELTTMRYRVPSAEQRLIQIDLSLDVLAAANADGPVDQYLAGAVEAGRALVEAVERAGVPAAKADVAARTEIASTDAADPTSSVARQLDSLLSHDAIVTGDAGDFYPPFARAIRYDGARRYLGPLSGAMGYALPAGIAASLAEPRRQVVALAGDGGFMMSVAELETAVRLRSRLIVVVINNSAYGSIRRHQNRSFDGRLIGVEFGRVSFADVACAMGGRGVAVTHENFTDAFEDAARAPGPVVLELCVEAS